jgi:hypothetical protein
MNGASRPIAHNLSSLRLPELESSCEVGDTSFHDLSCQLSECRGLRLRQEIPPAAFEGEKRMRNGFGPEQMKLSS